MKNQIQEEEVENIPTEAGGLQEYIEWKLENPPEKGSIRYKNWKRNINSTIDKYNTKFGKIFNRIK